MFGVALQSASAIAEAHAAGILLLQHCILPGGRVVLHFPMTAAAGTCLPKVPYEQGFHIYLGSDIRASPRIDAIRDCAVALITFLHISHQLPSC